MDTAKRATRAKPSKRELERISWFNYVDVLLAHGMTFTKRDVCRVGSLLKISTIPTDAGEPFGNPEYLHPDGTLRLERFAPSAMWWFTERHADAAKWLTLWYINPELYDVDALEMPVHVYQLALYFLQSADSNLRFSSKWQKTDKEDTYATYHESGMIARDARNAVTWLLDNKAIERVSKGLSAYRFVVS